MVEKVQPVVIEKANGATIVDTSGKEYGDCFSGIAVMNAGHFNEKVIEATKAQMDKLLLLLRLLLSTYSESSGETRSDYTGQITEVLVWKWRS
jgi:4-aminobutyrate aminotransferase-like enzyme